MSATSRTLVFLSCVGAFVFLHAFAFTVVAGGSWRAGLQVGALNLAVCTTLAAVVGAFVAAEAWCVRQACLDDEEAKACRGVNHATR